MSILQGEKLSRPAGNYGWIYYDAKLWVEDMAEAQERVGKDHVKKTGFGREKLWAFTQAENGNFHQWTSDKSK